MSKISCVVVDDQAESLDLMINHIKNCPLLSVKYSTQDPIQALAFLDQEPVDCIFLDIEMPQMTGLEFIETLKAKLGNDSPKIILITGYGEYALTGYEYGVFDYLLKPISFKRFKIAVDRLWNTVSQKVAEDDFFFADAEGKKIKIKFSEIIYVEGAGNYVYIITEEKKIVWYKTMNGIQELLPKNKFIRIHKSYIISINNIKSVRGNEVFLMLKGNSKNFPIGITYKEHLLKSLGIAE